MYTYKITYPKENGEVQVFGVDLGAIPIWWESNKSPERLQIGDNIVLKISGSNQWAGRGEMKYYGAYFIVLRILAFEAWGSLPVFKCEEVIQFPIRKKAA